MRWLKSKTYRRVRCSYHSHYLRVLVIARSSELWHGLDLQVVGPEGDGLEADVGQVAETEEAGVGERDRGADHERRERVLGARRAYSSVWSREKRGSANDVVDGVGCGTLVRVSSQGRYCPWASAACYRWVPRICRLLQKLVPS